MLKEMQINDESTRAFEQAVAELVRSSSSWITLALTNSLTRWCLCWQPTAVKLCSLALDGNARSIERVLAAGGDANAAEYSGWTPLMYASIWDREAAVIALLNAGADTNATDNDGQTALMYAAYEGFCGILRLLLQAGADWTIVDNAGKTASDVAKEMEKPDAVALLEDWAAKHL